MRHTRIDGLLQIGGGHVNHSERHADEKAGCAGGRVAKLWHGASGSSLRTQEGREAFPHTLLNPYAGIGDPRRCPHVAAGLAPRMRRHPRDSPEEERIARIAFEIDQLLD